MKTMLTLAAAAAIVCFIPCAGPTRTQAQTVAVVAGARYKVIDLTTISLAAGKTAAQSLETLLNDQSAQGWKLVAMTGNYVILSSP